MEQPFKVWNKVYQIGGAQITHPYDCSIYLVDFGDLVMIDCGAGISYRWLVANIKSLGLDINKLSTIVITHAHIDHIGALKQFKDEYHTKIIAHQVDAKKLESGTGVGAEYYGVDYAPCQVDVKISEQEDTLKFGSGELKTVHIPGHTPGSIALYTDIDGKRVLFGQDIRGPYERSWGADPEQAKQSLQKLIDLKADILCEGHFGIYQPASEVAKYIKSYQQDL